jgi:alanine racemase
MKDLLTRLSKARFPYEPLITVEISRNRLLHNLSEFQKLAPGGVIAPVLKSNAYGHGLVEVAHILETYRHAEPRNRSRLPFYIVDSYFEAIALRACRVRAPILVIGYTPPQTIDRARLCHTSFTVSSLETLRALSRPARPSWSYGNIDGIVAFALPLRRRAHRIHLKVDTGMRRQGILPEELAEALRLIGENSWLELEGLCSHLADADNADPTFTEDQIAVWNRLVKQTVVAFPRLAYLHIGASDGHRYVADDIANVTRLGIGMYGLLDGSTFSPRLNLFPTLEMKTVVSGVKTLRRGEHVGYGLTFTADRDMTVATIPVGYYEGLDRRLSNMGQVLVGVGRVPCRIVGRVSMNITVIDISPVLAAAHAKTTPLLVGAAVTVISNVPADPNSLESMAQLAGTIPYELAVHLPAHLKRAVV